MLFYSLNFIFIFLPLFFLFYLLFKKTNYLLHFFVLTSLIFYSLWDYRFLLLLVFSISINYLFLKYVNQNKVILTIGIVLNLSILVFFKYSGFVLNNIFQLNSDFLNSIILPLGISFFTFQQISCLVDAYKNKINLNGYTHYFSYVSFFPQLIAGPIVRYNQISNQLIDQNRDKKIDWNNINLGIIFFIIGFFKKVFFADSFGNVVDHYFIKIFENNIYDSIHYWYLIYNFALQIYFDFSAYTDMAIGLALIVNIKLPINFNSPYKTTNIIDFWRSWHISLSTFFRDYLYIPLGGKNNNFCIKLFLIIFVLTLAGLWHGANWTFLIWGFLHGIYIGFTHLIIKYKNIFKKIIVNKNLKKFLSIVVVDIFVLIVVYLFINQQIKVSYISTYYDYFFANYLDISHLKGISIHVLSIIIFILCFRYYYKKYSLKERSNNLLKVFLIFINFTIVSYLFIIFRSNSLEEFFFISKMLMTVPNVEIEHFIETKLWFKYIAYNFEFLIFIMGIFVVFLLPNSNQYILKYNNNLSKNKYFYIINNIFLGILLSVSIIFILKSSELETFIYFIF